jgi:hypothetical protein
MWGGGLIPLPRHHPSPLFALYCSDLTSSLIFLLDNFLAAFHLTACTDTCCGLNILIRTAAEGKRVTCHLSQASFGVSVFSLFSPIFIKFWEEDIIYQWSVYSASFPKENNISLKTDKSRFSDYLM